MLQRVVLPYRHRPCACAGKHDAEKGRLYYIASVIGRLHVRVRRRHVAERVVMLYLVLHRDRADCNV